MIPTIRLDAVEAEAPGELELLRQALRGPGVFYLDARQSLAADFFSDLFGEARRFFALPASDKESLDLTRSTNYRGYVGLGAELTKGTADLKESFEFAKETAVPADGVALPYFQLYGGNQWPDGSRLPRFQPVLQAYSEDIERIGLAALKGVARSLDQPVTPASEGGLCSFSRLIYYSDPFQFSAAGARLEAHTDHGLFTVIVQSSPGLEVETAEGWLPATPPEGTFVVFPGELMEFWTRGYYKACPHRVYNRALGAERLSVATFFLPDLRSTVAPVDPASSPHLAQAELAVASDNVWLTKPGGELRPIVVGEKEWERIHVIFPDEEQET